MDTMTIFSGVFLALMVVQAIWYEKRIKDMTDRLMATNFEEYKYYKKKYPTDLKEIEKLRKDARKEDTRTETELQFHNPETIKRLGRFEEDWGAEEVDEKQLEEMERSDMEMISDDMEKDNTKNT